MPTFTQHAIESLFAFCLLLGYYHLTQRKCSDFQARRWQLRLMPIFASLLPILPIFFVEQETATPVSLHLMSIGQTFGLQIPAFNLTVGKLLLVVYFAGVMVMSFRLADRFWLVSQFLQKKGNLPAKAPAWQSMPTALMGQITMNFQQFSEADKEKWASQWLPIHPAYAWEALLTEVLVVTNWFNPLAYAYRTKWSELYADWQVEGKRRTAIIGWPILGFASLAGLLGTIFVVIPSSISPTYFGGNMASNFFEKTIFEKSTPKHHEYVLEWGGVRVPLQKFANPNGYSAELELELSDFQKMINEELKVHRDGQPMKPGTLSIMYKSNRNGAQAYINGIDPKQVKLLQRHSGVVFNDSLSEGDNLVLFGDTEDIYLSKVEIRIKNPNAGYEPQHSVPEINHLEANMEFQIIARHGKRALVKIDPEHPNADRILALYGDVGKYEIVRIPGFRTNRHYLTEAESLASKVAAANTTLTYMETDGYYLPEYQGYQNKEVRMIWGNMEAAPSNTNYPLDSFLTSIQCEPRLLVGEDTLEIVNFDLVIASKHRPARSYWTYRTGDLAVKESLENVESETSIFFEKIVVFDGQRNRLLFPASFAFNVGELPIIANQPKNDKNYYLYFGEKTEVKEFPTFPNFGKKSSERFKKNKSTESIKN